MEGNGKEKEKACGRCAWYWAKEGSGGECCGDTSPCGEYVDVEEENPWDLPCRSPGEPW